MKKVCCGREVTTPFCPACGRAAGHSGPLFELLVHCKARLSAERSKLDTWNKACDEAHLAPERRGRRAEKIQKVIDKWQVWVAALEEVIAQ